MALAEESYVPPQGRPPLPEPEHPMTVTVKHELVEHTCQRCALVSTFDARIRRSRPALVLRCPLCGYSFDT